MTGAPHASPPLGTQVPLGDPWSTCCPSRGVGITLSSFRVTWHPPQETFFSPLQEAFLRDSLPHRPPSYTPRSKGVKNVS